MLLILFWMSVLCFKFSYLFSVLILGLFVLILMMMFMASMVYVKFIIILVYISGVVVFILYISCMCWMVWTEFSMVFLIFSLVMVFLLDCGMNFKFGNLGDYLWMFLYFAFLFNVLVSNFSLVLFKVSGSLRM